MTTYHLCKLHIWENVITYAGLFGHFVKVTLSDLLNIEIFAQLFDVNKKVGKYS